MAIEVKCPNGHDLRVKDRYAGKIGRCPHCQMPVQVPEPQKVSSGKLSDDEILNLVGPPVHVDLPVHQDVRHLHEEGSGVSLLGSGIHSSQGSGIHGSGSGIHGSGSGIRKNTKTCPKCKKEVASRYDICPHCHMYFSDLAEISRRMIVICPSCGTEAEPSHNRCVACGTKIDK